MRPFLTAVLTVLTCLSPLPEASAQTPVRIMPLGDSITYGAGAEGGYRNRLYQILREAGYAVDFVGTQTGNGTPPLPDSDHQGHPGWRIDQLDANISGWFDSILAPDVILLHIGTNDFGKNYDTPNAINRLDALITKMAILRPDARIIVTNLMERGEPYNSTIQTQFNPYVQVRVDAQAALGRHVTFLDMRSAVPLALLPDNLHPGQAGYDKMADAWLPAIRTVLETGPPRPVRAVASADHLHLAISFNKPLADSASGIGNYSLSGGLAVTAAVLDATKRVVTLTTDLQIVGKQYTVTLNGVSDRSLPIPLAILPGSTIAFYPEHPRGYQNNVPESLGYTLAYSLNLPAVADYKATSVPYTVDHHNSIGPFSRIAYYIELQQPNGDLRYLWASMNAFTSDAGKIAVPSLASGAVFQQAVTGLNVKSNLTNVDGGSGMTGNLEFWPTGSSPVNSAGIADASATIFDFGDTRSLTGNYGVMQLHNAAAGQTVFSFNNWGGNATPGNLDFGIGNNLEHVGSGLDWTYAHNAADYSVKSLQVLVLTTGDVAPPLPVSAASTFARTGIIVRFSEPLASGSVQAANFSINGVVVLGATLAANQCDVILTTTTQPMGSALTLMVSGVRDTSPAANRIAAGSTIAVSSAVLPPEIVAHVGTAANGYQLVCSLNIPVVGSFNAATSPYAFDERTAPGSFNRVAYYLELQKPGQAVQYVWTAMDAFTTSKGRIGIPTFASGAVFQQNVSNLDVLSNVSGVVNGTGMAGGSIEFWPTDYSAANALSVRGASGTTLDFGDTRRSTGNRGSMQVHNSAASQTVFALNSWGADGVPLDVGIGNDPTPTDGGVDWTFAANVDSYSRRILHVLVLPSKQPPPLPSAVAANVPEASGYQLVYSMNVPTIGNFNNTTGVYTVDNHLDVGSFSRIAYYLELQKTGDAAPSYVWTSMDAFTADAGKIGIPTAASGAIFQQNVTNLNVVSNAAGIVTGTGMAGGNIEFWPGNYSQANGNNVPNASGSTYDFGDIRIAGTGHGCMQVHNHDPGAKQTLFALNHWGVNGGTLELGIGNNPTPVNTGVDWTFVSNAASYDLKRVLHVFVLPVPDSTGPLLGAAKGSATCTRLLVTFNEPVADTAAAPANFSISGGVTVTGATLLAGQREIALTTSAQTPGAFYTVTATGVRDRSPAGNISLPGASAAFTAVARPSVLANIPESARYDLVYKLAIPDAANFNTTGVPYAVDESRYPQLRPFDRIAYCLELQLAGGGASSWVYTSADAFASQIGQIGVPTGVTFQQNLTNMSVFASTGAAVITGNGFAGGNIEFWPGNYAAGNAAGISNASATHFDFGDSRSAGSGYGSMQIHNHDASQTVFAFNNWGSGGGNNDLGIGNDLAPVNQGVDWTFHHNAATFSTKNLYVLVRPGGSTTGMAPVLLSQPRSRVVPPGGGTTFAVAVAGNGPLCYQWRFNGTVIEGATNAWLELTGLTAGQTGAYDVVVTGPGAASSISQAAALTVVFPNHAPTFAGYSFTSHKGIPVTLPFANLLSKAADADGDTLSISAVNSPSPQNATITLGPGGITYLPPPGFTGADNFTVTINDDHGGSTLGTLNVTVTAATTITLQSNVARQPNGKVYVVFHGTPQVGYPIERSLDLVTWTVLQTVVAGDDGIIPLTDTPPNTDKAFYRARAL